MKVKTNMNAIDTHVYLSYKLRLQSVFSTYASSIKSIIDKELRKARKQNDRSSKD